MNEILSMLKTIENRKVNPEEGSYTAYLFDKGKEKILKKLGEENTEIIIAAMKEDKQETIAEINDYLYHLFVLMVQQGITMEEIEAECALRNQKTGNLKPERKPIEKR